jgi:SAM-dependent methyltransferase
VNDPYADAALYDLEYADYTEDIPFYVERAAAARGAVLELGCGTGRLTLPMARAGARVIGTDRAGAMIERLRRTLSAEPPEVRDRVTLLQADYLAPLPLTEPVGLVVWPFNALHHCPDVDAIHAVLTGVRRACAPGARLALDCYLPAPGLLGRDPEGRHEPRTFHHPETGELLQSWEQDQWDEARRIHHVTYIYQRPNGQEHQVQLALHMYALPEIRRAVARAGWKLVYEAQDFRGVALTPAAMKWVGVARSAS